MADAEVSTVVATPALAPEQALPPAPALNQTAPAAPATSAATATSAAGAALAASATPATPVTAAATPPAPATSAVPVTAAATLPAPAVPAAPAAPAPAVHDQAPATQALTPSAPVAPSSSTSTAPSSSSSSPAAAVPTSAALTAPVEAAALVEAAASGNVALKTPKSTSLRRNRSFAQGDVVKYRRSFDYFDLEKKGKVKTSSLPDLIRRLGYRLNKDQLQEIFTKHDLKEGDTVTFEQFIEIIPRNDRIISEEEHQMAELREKFQRYDVDQNGVISLQEAQWALQVELKVTPQTALRLLNQFVKLDYNHFVEFYGQVQKKKLEIYDKFGRYDMDRDGMISVSEAHCVLHTELGFSEQRSRTMVERFDLNHDGQVSYMEFAEFYIAVEEKKAKVRAAFRHFDSEAQGFVTYEHAIEILRNLLGFTEEKCRSVTETYDKNKDGKIDYEEFVEFYSMLEEERQRLLDEFKRVDTDNDGLISFQEFKVMMLSKGYSQAEVTTLMTGYDVNKDGFLDLEEFKSFLSFAC